MKAKKYFGQNFISDKNLINKIVDVLGQNDDQLIIEIGPGTGALTSKLVDKFSKVVAIEIDQDMELLLKQKIKQSNFKLILGDILKIDLKKIIDQEKQHVNQNVSIISNLPYYITSEILFKILDLNQNLTKAVFMMQKEVATRICANENENNYNNLSIACQFYAIRKYEFTVNKGMFRPIPKVDSAVISLTFDNRYLSLVDNDKKFIEFVRKMFNNRRKNILNNLTNLTNDKQKSNEILDELKIETKLRPENLNILQYVSLYLAIN